MSAARTDDCIRLGRCSPESAICFKLQCLANPQVKAASVAIREDAVAKSNGGFDFANYMKERAEIVNHALDGSLPEQHPDVLYKSMR